MFELLNDNIPLKAYVLRVKNIMEKKGYCFNPHISHIINTTQGVCINLTMDNNLHRVDLSITPLDDDIYINICGDNSRILFQGSMELETLSKININNLLTNNYNDDII